MDSSIYSCERVEAELWVKGDYEWNGARHPPGPDHQPLSMLSVSVKSSLPQEHLVVSRFQATA